jgi:hypothetical protein
MQRLDPNPLSLSLNLEPDRYKIKETPSMQGLSWMDTRSNKLQGTYPDIMALLAAV